MPRTDRDHFQVVQNSSGGNTRYLKEDKWDGTVAYNSLKQSLVIKNILAFTE